MDPRAGQYQDNKGRQGTVETIVREFGFNNYRSIDGYDFSPALAYWDKTEGYWAMVRGAWEKRLSPGNTLELTTEVDGMPLIAGTFEQAENAAAQKIPSLLTSSSCGWR